MPTSLTNKRSNNNNGNDRRRTNEQSDEESMNIAGDNIDYTLNDIYNPSSFPFPTTFVTPNIVDYDKLLTEIMNEMRSTSNREFERFYESFFSEENDDSNRQRRIPLRSPSPLSLPSPVLDTRSVIDATAIEENELDDFLELANQIINNDSSDITNSLDDDEERAAAAIERSRREAVPITNLLYDEEPLLLYNENKGEPSTALHQSYAKEEQKKDKEEGQLDEILMVKRSPLTVNHIEYISSNGPEYEPQKFDFTEQQLKELFGIEELENVTQDASICREISNGEEEDDLSSWLCFDSETELQEFKKSFKEQEKKMTSNNILSTSLLNKINAIENESIIIEQELVDNVENNTTALKRRQQQDNKQSYTDGSFTYTKRIKPSF